MKPESLRVVHLLKDASVPARAPLYNPPIGSALFLDSCQRRLWVELSSSAGALPADPDFSAQVFFGSDAYAFLLSVATGLESQVIGETDIFGQLKDTWHRQQDFLNTELRKELSSWMQRLFEDTKEIRSRYLQHLGGSSYGSLLRKLLKDNGSLNAGPTLLVGAGQLARSVAPYLLDHELWICNRTAQRSRELAFELTEQNPSAQIRVLEEDEELSAIAQAAQLVICVPGEAKRDQQRLRALQESKSQAQVVHLGVRSAKESILGKWAHEGKFYSLEELFQIDRTLSAVRSVQVERARAACREKAILRALGGGSVSIAHGWEDLAAFG